MDTIQKRRALQVSLVLAMCVMALPSVALADDAVVPVGGVKVSAQLLSLIVGAFIPLLTAAVTNYKSKNAGFLLILLNVANGVITAATLSDGTAVFSQASFLNVVPGLVGSFISYYGILKPRGLTSGTIDVPGPTPGSTIKIPGKLSNWGLLKH